MAYVDATNDRLVVAACDDSMCTTATDTILDDGASLFDADIVIGAGGLPVIGYVMDLQARVAACDDVTCSAAALTTLDADGRMFHPDIAIGATGNPVMVYHENRNADLRFVGCASSTCK